MHGIWACFSFKILPLPFGNRVFTGALPSVFSLSMGSRPFRRGISIFLSGCAVTFVTFLFAPEHSIIFGILTFLDSTMIFTALLRKYLKKIPVFAGFFVCFLLFLLARNISKYREGAFRV